MLSAAIIRSSLMLIPPQLVVLFPMMISIASQNKKVVRGLLAAGFWLAVWQIAAAWVDLPLLLPGPFQVLKALFVLVGEGSFWYMVFLSLGRVLVGFILGAVLGAICAVLTVFVPLFDVLLTPIIRIIRASPVTSFILLCMLWIKSSFVPAFIAAIMVLPIVWENITQGFRNTDPKLLEMAKVFRMGKAKTFLLIYVPSALGYFRAACVTSMGMAFKSGVAAEVLCQPKLAVGTQVYYSKIYLETENLFAWTAVVVVMSIFMERLLMRLLRVKKN